ncbi:8-oxo-dGTP diphosphatase [Parabacteroides sp. PFB2-12]|uniref:NUDIX hydrolase n=1 Tax=unclassified Parabacteroides TaxID=2649774 RepID=UPI0024751CD0|nr:MULTISPECIES: NUDIX domain-containing protein [unclassified Parabacteroides]MDH6342196.1 8-oxo-dGTP diphosphatase [Parabacteroides sp. PM6-13]MDH6391120.1 8-oxo-dGTP diphosphatase [Parabacteroides sp. PFB2-12]MDL2309863.1 NUDIX domain-containing protein [Parabacteroides sp. OttesenSCG-928-B22]
MTAAFYKEQHKFLVAVDCIILGFKNGKLYLLISKRKFEPLKGQDTLMGGFLREHESLSETVSRVVYEYTGIEDVYMEQVGAYGEMGRDEGERVISVGYYALIDLEMFDEERCKIHDARWKELEEVGRLIFDHNLILEDTIDLLRRKAATQPIGFNMLPEKFTLPQLQSLYEAIYQTAFDKRNFRKKMLEMDILEKQEDKDKSSSKRGAFYYKFNKEKYDQLLEKGSYFSI